jgi:hypothetical protein
MRDIPKVIRDELDALTSRGVSWEVSPGKKHIKVKVLGQLVGILSRGHNEREPRAALNLRSSIRRAAGEAR